MKIGLLGSGNVGQALAKGFIAEGHEVYMATREPEDDKAQELKRKIPEATICDFATAAQQAELAVLCVKWNGAEEAVGLAGIENLAGKIVMETSNIIQPEGDTLLYGGSGGKSAAEQVQSWLPDSKVVKAFNTVGAAMMYKPPFDSRPTMFIAGDNRDAKQQISDIADAFGWEPLDAGNLIASRELEAMALVWIRNSMMSGSPKHAFKML